MFSKVALTSLILGALYVNALAIPVAREPTPEPEFSEISDGLLPREAEPEIQELETRIWGQYSGGSAAAGVSGNINISKPNKPVKSSRN